MILIRPGYIFLMVSVLGTHYPRQHNAYIYICRGFNICIFIIVALGKIIVICVIKYIMYTAYSFVQPSPQQLAVIITKNFVNYALCSGKHDSVDCFGGH